MTYQNLINGFCGNDAAIEAVAVALTLGSWLQAACTDAIESGAIVRRWWDANADAIKDSVCVGITMTALVLVFTAAVAYAAGLVVRGLVGQMAGLVEEALSLDGQLCPCVGRVPDWSSAEPEVTAADIHVHVFTAWAFERWGRKQDVDTEAVLAWAKQLVG